MADLETVRMTFSQTEQSEIWGSPRKV